MGAFIIDSNEACEPRAMGTAFAAVGGHQRRRMISSKPDELRVLVVDDDIAAANSLSYLLQITGCPTAVAYGGEMGVRIAQLFKPALVFVDLQMPGANDWTVFSEARLEGRLPRALYVCLTEGLDPAARDKCLSAGFDFLVPKPLQAESLGEILRAARSHAKLRRRGAQEMRPFEAVDRRAH
jgi:CheY-like chemotaxis protein